jgi:hypothetical protein
VGGTTANGHVIKSYDRFVALPSRRALASNGGNEYQVRVCYPVTGRCTTASVCPPGEVTRIRSCTRAPGIPAHPPIQSPVSRRPPEDMS